jgi:hypothetical protein
MTDDELEATLHDIGRSLAYPRAPDLTGRVRARITPRQRRPWFLVLAPAILTLVVIGAGAAAAELIWLRGASVIRVPASALPSPAPTVRLDIGDPISLDDARRITDFTVIVPSDAILGQPAQVARRNGATGAQITFVYAPSAKLPASAQTGVGALVTELRGSVDLPLFSKGAGPDTKIEQLTVNGHPGVWLEGAPHAFFFRDASGNIFQETLRLAGNTLLWEQNGVLIRLEAQVSRATALGIAEGIR